MFELKRYYTGWRAIFIRKPKILYSTKYRDEVLLKLHEYRNKSKPYYNYSVIFKTNNTFEIKFTLRQKISMWFDKLIGRVSAE